MAEWVKACDTDELNSADPFAFDYGEKKLLLSKFKNTFGNRGRHKTDDKPVARIPLLSFIVMPFLDFSKFISEEV